MKDEESKDSGSNRVKERLKNVGVAVRRFKERLVNQSKQTEFNPTTEYKAIMKGLKKSQKDFDLLIQRLENTENIWEKPALSLLTALRDGRAALRKQE